MIRRMRLTVLVGIVLGFSVTALAEDDLESVQKKIIEAWTRHKSLTAKMTMSSRLAVGDTTVTATGDGTYEFLRHEGKLLSRMDLKSTAIQKSDEQENKLDQHMLMISDGDISHTLIEIAGADSRVVKSAVAPNQKGDPKALFEFLRRQGAVAVSPEDTLEGRKVYVIEVIFRETPPFSPVKQRLSFDQESGFLVRIVGLGEGDLPMSTMTYSDIKVNVPIDPERFKFTIPEGVEVIDETMPEPPTTEPTTASQPASAPASRAAASQPAPAPQPGGPPKP